MSAGEQPRITVWWCDECGYWREQRSTGVHVHYGQNRGGVEHPLRLGMADVTHICTTAGRLPDPPAKLGPSAWVCPACGVGVAAWMPYCPKCADRAAVGGETPK